MVRINQLKSHHFGNQPTKVLSADLMEVFQYIHRGFLDELKYEITDKGLPKDITYDNRQAPITLFARINEEGIYINEGYLAFIWGLSYFIITVQRERAKPRVSNNPVVRRAIDSLNYTLTLFERWTPWNLQLPNPQEYDLDLDPYIEEANGLYLYAACLILCHEFSHQQLGHLVEEEDPDQEDSWDPIQAEFEADKRAVETFLTAIKEYGRDMPRAELARLGAAIGMGSIFFPHTDFDGGDEHPDVDERYRRVVDQFAGGDDSNDLWRWAIGVLIAWVLSVKKDLSDIPGFHEEPSPKAQFELFVQHLKDQMLY